MARLVFVPLAAFLAFTASSVHADIGGEPSSCHALTHVRIVALPGAAPVEGTLVIRDGRIESMGAQARIPDDAIVHDLTGRIVYPGLVEPYLRLDAPKSSGKDGEKGKDSKNARTASAHANDRVRAEVRAVESLPLPDDVSKQMREAGFVVANVVPSPGIFRGSTAVISLGKLATQGTAFADVVQRSDFAQAFAFEHGSWDDETYPGSLMGAIALARQTILDAGWHRDSWRAWEKTPGKVVRPEENVSLRALLPVVDRRMPLFMESEDIAMTERAFRFALEFKLRPILVSGGSDDWRRVDWMKRELDRAGASLVVAVNFPEVPVWQEDEDRPLIEQKDLVQWERAPANLAALEQAHIPFATTTQGLESRDAIWERLREAVDRGLSRKTALASLTTEPARLLGIDSRTGTLAPGKDADLLIATGDLFDKGTEIEEVWIDGVRYGEDPRRANEKDVAGEWNLAVGQGKKIDRVRIELKRTKEKMSGKVVLPPGQKALADTAADQLHDLELARGELSFEIDSAAWSGGDAEIHLHRDGKFLRGWADVPLTPRETGRSQRMLAVLGTKAAGDSVEYGEDLTRDAPVWPPVADAAHAPKAVLVQHATIWTSGPKGTLEDADLLVRDGKIAAVGKRLSAPKGAVVIDAEGRHVTAGIIDCHSHSDIAGSVNEGTNSCTAEVRIADVVNPESPALYRELAAGVTVANLLHGSANAIGGQNAVIKLRWGSTADEMFFGAPQGIKFALGENVKQSNWGDEYTSRYPQTRMGVEQFVRDRFFAALNYRAEQEAWSRTKKGEIPRRDLQLDAILEVLDGKRFVHCHSYRSDEILMLMRLAEEHGFRIKTFQHVLEGYKVADELAAHGAGASGFADNWSYKFEVVDAIPYLGEILWKRGVLTSYNSDSWETSRRLNLEAAKAVKYGGVPEDEALKFVTFNPAKQLGIEKQVGSLEPGKDADFVIWSGHPLSDNSVCLETWMDGVRRFSRADDLAQRARMEKLRGDLLDKAERVRRVKDKLGVLRKAKKDQATFGTYWGRAADEEMAMPRGECVHFEGAAACCDE
ncbi:MAG TPA: amidohydrolase family protein [bacterium]|nr:amidohydrolase family protein [bacterium]